MLAVAGNTRDDLGHRAGLDVCGLARTRRGGDRLGGLPSYRAVEAKSQTRARPGLQPGMNPSRNGQLAGPRGARCIAVFRVGSAA